MRSRLLFVTLIALVLGKEAAPAENPNPWWGQGTTIIDGGDSILPASETPSVIGRSGIAPLPPPALPTELPKKRKKAPVRFVGRLLPLGVQATNRDNKVDPSYTARLDIKANLPIPAAEQWAPRVRFKTEFMSLSQSAAQFDDPRAFRSLNFDAGLFERVLDGVEVGVHGGITANFDRPQGVEPQLEGPARWGVGVLLYYKEHWCMVSLGQDQRLPVPAGWNQSAAVTVDAGVHMHQEGRIEMKVLVGLIKGTRPGSDLLATVSFAVGASKKL